MADYLVDLVNEQDVVIGKVLRSEAHANDLPHRIALVFVLNEKGEILLQTRKEKGDGGGNLLGASVGGHVDQGESYESAAAREMEEELGIHVPITFHSVVREHVNRGFNHFGHVFLARSNGPFLLDPVESQNANFYSLNEIRGKIDQNPHCFTPATLLSLKNIISNLKD